MAGSWQVYVDGLEFYGYHGVEQAERQIGHRFRVRIDCDFEGPEDPGADDVRATLDYGAIAEVAFRTGTEGRYRTLEALAWAMAAALFDRFQILDAVSITLEKALPPIASIVEAAGVQLTVERDDVLLGRPPRGGKGEQGQRRQRPGGATRQRGR